VTTKLQDLNLAEMNVSQLRSAIKDRYEEAKAIEDRYPNGLTKEASAEDYEQAKSLLGELDVLEDRLLPLEEATARKERITGNVNAYNRSSGGHRHAQADDVLAQQFMVDPGQQFIDSEAYKHAVETGLLNNNRNRVEFAVPMQKGTNLLQWGVQHKAIFTSGSAVGGPLVMNDVRPGMVDILQRQIVITDMIPRTPTESDTIEYVREDTFTNSAAFTAEASATTGTSGTKPESALAYSTQTAPVKTLAHWIPVTNRMMSDAPALRGLINARLLLGLDLALESQIIDGDGTGENLTGILRTAGINIESAGSSNNAMDAIFRGRTQVMVTGLARPTGIVIHPNDWQAIRLSRENAASATLGGYLMGPPNVAGPLTLWGLPVAEAIGIPENTSLVGDFAMGAMLFDREQGQIRTGLINDQFVRNMQTVLAELRLALVVFRPTAFAKVTGV
jgi:HK97 family phage major capsid protein